MTSIWHHDTMLAANNLQVWYREKTPSAWVYLATPKSQDPICHEISPKSPMISLENRIPNGSKYQTAISWPQEIQWSVGTCLYIEIQQGRFRTARHKEYPGPFCKAIANAFAKQFCRIVQRRLYRTPAAAHPAQDEWISSAAKASECIATAHWLPDFQDL